MIDIGVQQDNMRPQRLMSGLGCFSGIDHCLDTQRWTAGKISNLDISTGYNIH
jgi:hypothetical protein